MKEVDLTGDGKPDTVVDEALFQMLHLRQPLQWRHRGQHGALPRRRLRNRPISCKGWDTANWAGSTLILLALHGGECGGAGVDPCFEALTWGANAFVSVRPKQN